MEPRSLKLKGFTHAKHAIKLSMILTATPKSLSKNAFTKSYCHLNFQVLIHPIQGGLQNLLLTTIVFFLDHPVRNK